MLLDNLFATVGTVGTSLILFGIVAVLGVPAAAAVLFPNAAYHRVQRSR